MELPVRILGTGSALPARIVPTALVAQAAWPDRDAAWLIRRTGIRARRWVEPGERPSDLATRALGAALEMAGLEVSALSRVIYVSSIGGDVRGPATANRVVSNLGGDGRVGCFDLNNACVGFVSALDLAARLVATGEGPVGVVAAEVFSPWIGPDRPREYAVMADAAGAAVVGPARRHGAVLATHFANDGARFRAVSLGHSAPRIIFGMAADEIAAGAVADTQAAAEDALAQAGVGLDAVRWILPHQPNGPMLQAFMRALGCGMDRTRSIVEYAGSVGSVSVPLALDRLWRAEAIADGQLLLFAAVGAGASRSAQLWRVERG